MNIYELCKELDIDTNDKLFELALTDSSFRNTGPEMNSIEVNDDLGTLGDAVLRCLQTNFLFDQKVSQISNMRQRIEGDHFLVAMAEKLDLINVIHFDRKDMNKNHGYYPWQGEVDDQIFQNIVKGIEYHLWGSMEFNSSQKYIATCMEAIIGAAYLITGKNIVKMEKLVRAMGLLIIVGD